jgi:murein DD-endopeptidase MepM/ murein hydrolase activator NlpD
MRGGRDLNLGSTGRWPVAFGSLAECIFARSATRRALATLRDCHSGSRQAGANYRPAAYAPRKRRRRRWWFIAVFALPLWSNVSVLAQNQVVDLALPTDNDALFRGGGPAFYQSTERDYEGVKSTPWEGGQYGFVRDPVETPEGIVYTRFHEGIDIRPLQRDARGEPLDQVRAIADGKVVHANLVPGYSNYGNYIVIEHRWDRSRYYSLYGHLSAIAVRPGQTVRRGEGIAVMGYTGAGLNQARAHVHLELNFMLSHRFESWYNACHKNDPNHNGIYNGINLAGLDIARLYLALRKNPSLTIPDFIAEEETFYKVTLPKSRHFELPKLYPWMLTGAARTETPSWEVSFARSGLPLKIEPSSQRVTQPELSYVKKSSIDYSYLTQDKIAGRGEKAHLTEGGRQLMRLLIYPD